jgi:hypothetical protein
VQALWLKNCADLGTPLLDSAARLILDNLRRTVPHPDAHCIVAVEGGAVVGYLTCCVMRHPVMPGLAGEIEELYVLPRRGRRVIETALVREAVLLLKRQSVCSIHTRTGTDGDEARSRAFWRQLGWDNDMTIFSIYQSVPGDPALQGVWDAYAP